MKRFWIAAAAALAFVSAAAAETGSAVNGIPTPLPPQIVIQQPSNFDQPAPVVTVSQPKETPMLGDYAAALLEWLAPLLAAVLGPLAVDAYVKFRARLGLSTTDAQRQKLQEFVENGVNLGAHDLGHDLTGKIPLQGKAAIMASALAYVQAHGSDTLAALGASDPNDPKVVEAIRARIATALADKESSITPTATAAAPPTKT